MIAEALTSLSTLLVGASAVKDISERRDDGKHDWYWSAIGAGAVALFAFFETRAKTLAAGMAPSWIEPPTAGIVQFGTEVFYPSSWAGTPLVGQAYVLHTASPNAAGTTTISVALSVTRSSGGTVDGKVVASNDPSYVSGAVASMVPASLLWRN